MNVLLLNAGSSSLKITLMARDGTRIAHAVADWAGAATRYQSSQQTDAEQVTWQGHGAAVERFIADLPAAWRASLSAVAHRIVHGGSFTSSVRITAEVRSRIADLVKLAPLHNPPSLDTLAAAERLLPDLPHVAVFDTAFHATLPEEAYTYALPTRWTQEWGIRRYGFHGLSHAYCARRATEMLGPRSQPTRIVICHLGHGCSASAVYDGRCIDTTMGFTPLDGLVMATRCGAIDPSIILHVQERHGLSTTQIHTALNRESGLLGVSGVSADMRQVLTAAESGNEQARLAIAIYTRRVRQTIGAFAVTMGGIDALVFTAGVGEHAAGIRAAVGEGLQCLGLQMDEDANRTCQPDGDIACANSPGRIFVIATREDLTMLTEVLSVLNS